MADYTVIALQRPKSKLDQAWMDAILDRQDTQEGIFEVRRFELVCGVRSEPLLRIFARRLIDSGDAKRHQYRDYVFSTSENIKESLDTFVASIQKPSIASIGIRRPSPDQVVFEGNPRDLAKPAKTANVPVGRTDSA